MDDRRKSDRFPIKSDVEFATDHKILGARGVDVSDTGVAFETDEPLSVALTITIKGEQTTRQAKLVRVSKAEDGGYRFGLEFLD